MATEAFTEHQMIVRILINYFETYADEKTYPRKDHAELWKELDFIRIYCNLDDRSANA